MGNSIGKIFIKQLIASLTKEGERLIAKALKTITYTHRTRNLKDSYGSAVYYNGALQMDSVRISTPEATEPRIWYRQKLYGSEEIIEFFQSYQPRTKGIELVLAVAMPYAEILEKKLDGLKRKYKVVSGARTEFDKLTKKYEGTVTEIGL